MLWWLTLKLSSRTDTACINSCYMVIAKLPDLICNSVLEMRLGITSQFILKTPLFLCHLDGLPMRRLLGRWRGNWGSCRCPCPVRWCQWYEQSPEGTQSVQMRTSRPKYGSICVALPQGSRVAWRWVSDQCFICLHILIETVSNVILI